MSRHRSRRRSPPRRSQSAPHGVGTICLVAGLALLCVMGVTVFKDKVSKRTRAVEASTPVAPIEPTPTPRVVVRPPAGPVQRLARQFREIEKGVPALRRATRGDDFEPTRVALLARTSRVRDELGAFLDRHPSHDRGQRLWDRVLKVYVALKKL